MQPCANYMASVCVSVCVSKEGGRGGITPTHHHRARTKKKPVEQYLGKKGTHSREELGFE